MLHRRRFCFKWTAIVIAYICIFLLSYEFGTNHRYILETNTPTEPPVHLLIKKLFHDHPPYLNSSMILPMIEQELKRHLVVDMDISTKKKSSTHHGLVVFYDYAYHHVYFRQFLWLFSSWSQLEENDRIHNDLVVFISSFNIPDDFQKLLNLTRKTSHRNQLLIYPCQTLVDSILDQNYRFLSNFSPQFHMELARLFYWQQTRLSSLLLFLHEYSQEKLIKYDYIFRLDVDSFFMTDFARFQPTTSLILGQAIPHDRYTLNRLKRITKYFRSQAKISVLPTSITISWFGKLNLLRQLIRQVLLMTVWLMKEEFTESERSHHLTYLNYPSWYIDGIFEYATAIILSLHQLNNSLSQSVSQFDCYHLLTHCLHISLRDPSHHLHLSKHSLHFLTSINSSNLTQNELYIYRTVIKSNEMFKAYFTDH